MKRFLWMLLVGFLLLPFTPPESVRQWLAFECASRCWAADLVYFVDPDAVGGGTGADWANAYTSLFDGEADQDGINGNLVGGGNTLTFLCRSGSGGDDTTAVAFGGWVTGPGNEIIIKGDDFPADGVWDDNAYTFAITDAIGIQLTEEYMIVDGIQVLIIETSTNTAEGIRIHNVGTAVFTIKNVIFRGNCSGTGTGFGLYVHDSSATAYVFNCIFYDIISGADSGFAAILQDSAGGGGFWNITIHNCYRGITGGQGSGTAVNIIAADITDTDEINYGGTVTNVCSDTGGEASAGDFQPSGADWANEMADYLTDDFTLTAGGNCEDNGADDPGGANQDDTDIIGAAWGTQDIGAYAVGGAAPAEVGQLIFIMSGGALIWYVRVTKNGKKRYSKW